MLRNTGVPEDEGQHLQTVFPNAAFYGGPGEFAFNADSYLDEKSGIISEANRSKLIKEWSKHWDLTKAVLLEKSPPNLIRTRFLQAMFPGAYFITVVRHPVAVAYATQKMFLTRLADSWVSQLPTKGPWVTETASTSPNGLMKTNASCRNATTLSSKALAFA